MLVGVLSVRGNNGIDTDNTLTAANGIDAAMDFVKPFSQGVGDLVKRDQLDCVLVTDPLQWHSGYICA